MGIHGHRDWQTTLGPRMPSCLCDLLAIPFSYSDIASFARVPAHSLLLRIAVGASS